MWRPLESLRGALDRNAAPAVVLATALASAVLAAAYVARVVEAQERSRFRELVGTSEEALRRRLDAYVAKLRSARGFVRAFEGDPPPEAFRGFVASFELPRYYPGIQGIGWARVLRPEEVAEHEAAVRAGGDPDYRVWPEGARELYSSIVLLEPLDWRNERAIGYDMFSEPTRRAAMERARDTGDVAASGKVELVQEAGANRQAGFLIYLAVYERPPATLEERRAGLRGWVYAPFRAADLLHGSLGPEPARAMGLSVYDGDALEPQALLYDAGVGGRPTLTALRTLEVGGRTWTLRYAATRAFASRTERALPAVVLAAGIAVGLLLFSIVRADARARRRAERAAARASFLAEVGKALSASPESEGALPGVADLAADRVADGCLVHLLDAGPPGWIVGHQDPALAARAVEKLSTTRLEEGDALGALASLRSGEAQLRRLDPRDPDATSLGAAVRELGAARALTVPLLARAEPLGVLVLLAGDGRRFEADDVRLGEDLARLVSAAVDTARLYRQAQEAVAARDEFLSIASHELKTPLTSLVLHADSLRATAARGHLEQAARKAEVIRRNVDRLSRLVANLLDISRISAGRLDLELEEVDLCEVVHEVVARFEDEARRAGCTLRVSADGAVAGRWDRLRVDQVVTNLLSNAIKYGPGKPVEIRVEPAGERALVSVRDHGIGISEPDQARIFQRFERAVSKRNYGGFGLGLWIVRQIVEALGGTVRVESLPGEGSTFTVELHRALREAPPDRPANPPGAPSQPGNPAG